MQVWLQAMRPGGVIMVLDFDLCINQFSAMSRKESFRLDLVGVATRFVVALALLVFPVLMSHASVSERGHEQAAHESHGPANDFSTSGDVHIHDAQPSPAASVMTEGSGSDEGCPHAGIDCCSSFCSGALAISASLRNDGILPGEYAANPNKALLAGVRVGLHRPPNS